jgi:hypothetical protein
MKLANSVAASANFLADTGGRATRILGVREDAVI